MALFLQDGNGLVSLTFLAFFPGFLTHGSYKQRNHDV